MTGITLHSKELTPEKIKLLTEHYLIPENCSELYATRVNPEIWEQLNAARRKTDLQLSNLQQTARKTAVAVLQIANELLPQTNDDLGKNVVCRLNRAAWPRV